MHMVCGLRVDRVTSGWLAVALVLGACRSPVRPADVGQGPDGLREVHATIEALYLAFCFDAGGEPDWEAMRALFVEGAAFVPPIAPGATPAAGDADAFLSDFARWIETSDVGTTGLHERILRVRVDRFGHIAHAWVAFEGHLPGEADARTRGLDSIQLVLDGERWKVASFTSQYEGRGLLLPTRFR